MACSNIKGCAACAHSSLIFRSREPAHMPRDVNKEIMHLLNLRPRDRNCMAPPTTVAEYYRNFKHARKFSRFCLKLARTRAAESPDNFTLAEMVVFWDDVVKTLAARKREVEQVENKDVPLDTFLDV